MTLHTVLTDFDLARFIGHTASLGTRTMLAGSPGYQSPEQLRAESTGPPIDVYAFGGVCFVTFAKTPLWPGLGIFQIIQKVTNNVLVWFSSVLQLYTFLAYSSYIIDLVDLTKDSSSSQENSDYDDGSLPQITLSDKPR